MAYALPRSRTVLQKTRLGQPEVEMVKMNAGFDRLFGQRQAKLNPNVDDSHIDDVDPLDNQMFSEVDEKRIHRKLRKQSTEATAALINEKYGLPLIFIATQVVITREQWWNIRTMEIRQLSWAEVGPTGIPRTNTWMSGGEEGGTNRFRHYFTMPNELLLDDEYGPDNLAVAMESVIETCLYTIILQTLLGIAERPMINRKRLRERHQEGPGDYYTYIMRVADHFALAAQSVDTARHYIIQNLHNDGNGRNGIITPMGKESFLGKMEADKRSFSSKVRDETLGAQVLGAAERQLEMDVHGAFDVPGIGRVGMIVAPTLAEWSGQAREYGFQALNRWVTFGYQYDFPRGLPTNAKDFTRDRLCVLVHRIDRSGGRWERVYLDQGITKTRGSYWYASVDKADPSTEAAQYLANINTQPELREKLFQSILTMDDSDSPSKFVAEQLKDMALTREYPTGWRDIDHKAHFDPVTHELISVYQAGEIAEPFFHSVTFYELSRRIVAHELANGGVNALASRLVQLFGLPTANALDFVTALNGADGIGPMVNEAALAEALKTFFFENFRNRASKIGLGKAKGHAAHLPPDRDDPKNPDAALKSVVAPLYAILGNTAAKELDLRRPLFDRLATEQSDKTTAIVQKIETKLKEQGRDAGLMNVYLQTALADLSKAGFTLEAATSGAPLPEISDPLVKRMGRLVLPQGAETASHVLAADHEEWTRALGVQAALASSTAALGARSTSYWSGDGLADVNARRELEDYVPIDFTRYTELMGLVPTMTALELGVMLQFFRLEMSPRNQARMANMGILFSNYSAARLGECQRTCDLITMKVEHCIASSFSMHDSPS